MKKHLCDFPAEMVADVFAYIHAIETQSPIVGTSHFYLHAMVKKHGETFDDAVDAYFRDKKEQARGKA